MNLEMMTGYRATMFDGDAGLDWLRQGWRGLRLYSRMARDALAKGDMALKAKMLDRAGQLLTIMSGLLDTSTGTTLGPALMQIYTELQRGLLRANANNDICCLDDFEQAVSLLADEMLQLAEHGATS